jgi:UDP-2-acetamido-2,6-beta-L-arabino-hexul-4-ose reductase
MNRATPVEVEQGNPRLAEDVVAAIRRSGARPVVFANSIHADADTPYGSGSGLPRPSSIPGSAMPAVATSMSGCRNLFGEHGRPEYNSFVATFVDCVAGGRRPDIVDRPVNLLHVQQAAALLLDGLTASV